MHEPRPDHELLCGSLFSGVGGMDLGFTWAGFRHAFFAEIDPFGRAVLAERFPGVPIYEDVCDVPECGSGIPWGSTRTGDGVSGSVLHAGAGDSTDDDANSHGAIAERRLGEPRRLDVLTFGSPCQDLSVAGKRRGLDGDRSGLFWEAMRIAGDGPLRPRALLMENVEGLLSSNGGRDFALVLDAMAERGYRWSYRVLDSQHFAVPQRRRRVFVCAVADDDPRAERIAEVFALAESSGGDSPTSDPSWPRASSRAGAGAPGSSGDDAVMRERERERERESHPRRYGQVGEGQRRTSGRRVSEPRTQPRVVGCLTATYGEQSGQDFGPSGAGLVTSDDLPIGVNPSNTDIAGTLPSNQQGGQRTTDIAGAFVYRKSACVSGPDTPETWVDDGLANTLNSFDVGDVRTTHAVVNPAIGFSHTQGLDPQAREEMTPTLRSNGGGMAANVGPAVRRLTPLECERLQGWPDDWTDIPWNGKDHAPDSRRYAACGNGVTATVAYWIAARLAEMLK